MNMRNRKAEQVLARRVSGRLALLIGGLAVAVGLVEVGARLLSELRGTDLVYPGPGTAPLELHVADSEAGMVPRPGFTGTWVASGLRVRLRTNSLGLRGPELGLSTPAAERWLVLGDSFVAGLQVTEEDHFVTGLSTRLGVEALNAGVDDFSTWQAVARYRTLAERVDVDGAVLVFYLGNDIANNERESGYGPPPGGHPVPDVPWWQGVATRNSALFAGWRIAALKRQLTDPNHPQRQALSEELWPFIQQGQGRLGTSIEQATRPALHALRQLAEDQGDHLMVALAPSAFTIDPVRQARTMELMGLPVTDAMADEPGRLVRRELTRLDIETCDLAPDLRRAIADGVKPFFTWEGHWTPAGHAIVADTLARCMEAGGHGQGG